MRTCDAERVSHFLIIHVSRFTLYPGGTSVYKNDLAIHAAIGVLVRFWT